MVCRVLDQHVPGAGFEYRTQPLYPSDDLVPSDYLVPDANLCIRRAGPELEAALERVDRKAGQDELRARAGSPVLPLVDAAMAYLKWLHETEKTPHPPSRS